MFLPDWWVAWLGREVHASRRMEWPGIIDSHAPERAVLERGARKDEDGTQLWAGLD